MVSVLHFLAIGNVQPVCYSVYVFVLDKGKVVFREFSYFASILWEKMGQSVGLSFCIKS